MQELVTLEAVAGVVLGLALGLGALGAAALLTGWARRRERWRRAGVTLVVLGAALGLAWGGYRWAVRLDPVTEQVGLYRPVVLLALVVIFAGGGVALGAGLRRLGARRGPGESEGRER